MAFESCQKLTSPELGHRCHHCVNQNASLIIVLDYLYIYIYFFFDHHLTSFIIGNTIRSPGLTAPRWIHIQQFPFLVRCYSSPLLLLSSRPSSRQFPLPPINSSIRTFIQRFTHPPLTSSVHSRTLRAAKSFFQRHHASPRPPAPTLWSVDMLSCDKWKCHRTAPETDWDKSPLNNCDGCHVQEEPWINVPYSLKGFSVFFFLTHKNGHGVFLWHYPLSSLVSRSTAYSGSELKALIFTFVFVFWSFQLLIPKHPLDSVLSSFSSHLRVWSSCQARFISLQLKFWEH